MSDSRWIPLVLALAISTGCSYEGGLKLPGVYRIDVQQGNVMDQEILDRLRPGMDRNQVEFILGTPAIADPFHEDRWDYLFTFSDSGARREQRHISVFFENNRLVSVEGDVVVTDRQRPDNIRQSRTVDVPPEAGMRRSFWERMMSKLPFVDDEPVGQTSAPADEPPEE